MLFGIKFLNAYRSIEKYENNSKTNYYLYVYHENRAKLNGSCSFSKTS